MGKQQTYWRYESLDTLLAEAFQAPHVAANLRLQDWRRVEGDGWYCNDRKNIAGTADARRAFSEPLFPAGVARLERLAEKLEAPTPVSIRRKPVRGDHGDEVDMSRVWTGHLETAWTRAARTVTPNVARVLIGVFVGGVSDLRAEALAWRGAAGLALAAALDGAGFAVEVRAVRRSLLILSGGETGPEHSVDVTIKAVGQPLDTHKAASLIASPLLFRGILLPHAATHARAVLDTGSSRTVTAAPTMQDTAGFDFVCCVPHEVLSQSAAQAWITKTLTQIEAKEERTQ
jgi:hypothetical protein